MAQTIFCVRHAQGFHNISVHNHSMLDPLLTPEGEEQCRTLQRNFPHPEHIDLVVASPLKRTIDTALIGFQDVLKQKNLKVLAVSELQETSSLPCDTGTDVAELRQHFAGQPVDLGLVTKGWNSKRLKWAPTTPAIRSRANDVKSWLMKRPEKNIVVVTHGGFLHYLTDDWDEADHASGTGWANTEFRKYTFAEDDNATPPRLIEDPKTRELRKEQQQQLLLGQDGDLRLTRTLSRKR